MYNVNTQGLYPQHHNVTRCLPVTKISENYSWQVLRGRQVFNLLPNLMEKSGYAVKT